VATFGQLCFIVTNALNPCSDLQANFGFLVSAILTL
jgi:hypothetical protein